MNLQVQWGWSWGIEMVNLMVQGELLNGAGRQIEWGIGSAVHDADEFAAHLCSELGLGGKFANDISHK